MTADYSPDVERDQSPDRPVFRIQWGDECRAVIIGAMSFGASLVWYLPSSSSYFVISARACSAHTISSPLSGTCRGIRFVEWYLTADVVNNFFDSVALTPGLSRVWVTNVSATFYMGLLWRSLSHSFQLRAPR